MTDCVRLRSIRETRGISAAELAHQVGVSRQTIYQIEDGGFYPNTSVALRLARVLETTVENIFPFEELDTSAQMDATPLTDAEFSAGAPVKLCRVGDRLTAIPSSFVPSYLPEADAIVRKVYRGKVSLSGDAPPDDGKRLLIAGCDPALSLLSAQLHRSGVELIGVPTSSRRALEWVKAGRVHAGGTHLADAATGEYNLPIIRRLLPRTAVRLVTFASWELGLAVAHGNPKTLRSLADLARPELRFINREKGAGSRDLLDNALKAAGIKTSLVPGYDSLAEGHMAAAQNVASGLADACIAPRSAARYFALDFIPLAVERFDLCFCASALDMPATRALLDTLQQSRLRRKLQDIAGYDTTHTGEVLI